MSEQSNQPIPTPPIDVTSAERLAAGEERWQQCPLRDCKRDTELLYEDFYLRGMRSNRLLCSQCAVRVPTGYMAREEVKKADDKFFQGKLFDDMIVLGLMFFASVGGNLVTLFTPSFSFYVEMAIGGGIGAATAALARRLTKGRVSRQTQYWGVAGIVAGALAVSLFGMWGISSVLFCTGAMIAASWGIFLRRI